VYFFKFPETSNRELKGVCALVQGLPFPILTVGEYFTVDAEGFCWGRSYRQAGYYTSFFLW
jgi:dual oxidase maturation factor 1